MRNTIGRDCTFRPTESLIQWKVSRNRQCLGVVAFRTLHTRTARHTSSDLLSWMFVFPSNDTVPGKIREPPKRTSFFSIKQNRKSAGWLRGLLGGQGWIRIEHMPSRCNGRGVAALFVRIWTDVSLIVIQGSHTGFVYYWSRLNDKFAFELEMIYILASFWVWICSHIFTTNKQVQCVS